MKPYLLVFIIPVVFALLIWGVFEIVESDSPLDPPDLQTEKKTPSSPRIIDQVPDKEKVRIASKELKIEPGMGRTVTGEVTEHRTGKPIKGAIVIPEGMNNLYWVKAGRKDKVRHAITDEGGRFVLRGLQAKEQKIVADHPEYCQGFRTVDLEWNATADISIPLKGGARVYGRVLDDLGNPAQGVQIAVWGNQSPLKRRAYTDKEGFYRSDPVLPGRLSVSAVSRDPEIDFTTETKHITMTDQDQEVNFGDQSNYITWRGKVLDADGKPLEGCSLSLGHVSGSSGMYSSKGYRSTDRSGFFEIKKIRPGKYNRVYVKQKGSSKKSWKEVFPFTKPGVYERDIRIGRFTGQITGTVYDGVKDELASYGMVFAYMDPGPHSYSAKLDDVSAFRFNELPAGRYNLLAMGGYGLRWITGIVLGEGAAIYLDVETQPYGTLELRYPANIPKDRKLLLVRKGDNVRLGSIRFSRGSTVSLETGKWEMYFVGDGVEELQSEFVIKKNKTTTQYLE